MWKELLDIYVASTRNVHVLIDTGVWIGPGVITPTEVDGSCGLMKVEGLYTLTVSEGNTETDYHFAPFNVLLLKEGPLK